MSAISLLNEKRIGHNCRYVRKVGSYVVDVDERCKQSVRTSDGRHIVKKRSCRKCWESDKEVMISFFSQKYIMKNGVLRYYIGPGKVGFSIYEVGYSLPLIQQDYFSENSAKLDCMQFNAYGPERIMETYWIYFVVGTHPLGTKPKTYSEWREENKKRFYREDRR